MDVLYVVISITSGEDHHLRTLWPSLIGRLLVLLNQNQPRLTLHLPLHLHQHADTLPVIGDPLIVTLLLNLTNHRREKTVMTSELVNRTLLYFDCMLDNTS